MSWTSKLTVNLFGGPGVGKSTLACLLYAELKKQYIETEYLSDTARTLILEGNIKGVENNIYLFGLQLHELSCAYEVSQVVICDSPMLLGAIYRPWVSDVLPDLILEQHNKFNNLNILLARGDVDYSEVGRMHSLVESIQLDRDIEDYLDKKHIPYRHWDSFTMDVGSLAEIVKAAIE
jgi:hypothetical protein